MFLWDFFFKVNIFLLLEPNLNSILKNFLRFATDSKTCETLRWSWKMIPKLQYASKPVQSRRKKSFWQSFKLTHVPRSLPNIYRFQFAAELFFSREILVSTRLQIWGEPRTKRVFLAQSWLCLPSNSRRFNIPPLGRARVVFLPSTTFFHWFLFICLLFFLFLVRRDGTFPINGFIRWDFYIFQENYVWYIIGARLTEKNVGSNVISHRIWYKLI